MSTPPDNAPRPLDQVGCLRQVAAVAWKFCKTGQRDLNMDEEGSASGVYANAKMAICRFRLMFETINATLIAASPSTKHKARARDPQICSTKKNNQWYFGMKAHIGADIDSGLAHGLKVSPAKTHDSRKIDDLLHGHEQVIVGSRLWFKGAQPRVP